MSDDLNNEKYVKFPPRRRRPATGTIALVFLSKKKNCIGVSPPPQKRRPLWSSREEEAPQNCCRSVSRGRARWGYSSARRSRRRRWCWCRRSSITLPSPPAPGSSLPLSPPFRTLCFVLRQGSQLVGSLTLHKSRLVIQP